MEMTERRQHRRFQITDDSLHARIAPDKTLKIMDISIGGALLQTDLRLNISKEYTMQLDHKGKHYPIKGSIVWSVLKESVRDQQGNIIPIYQSGMQFLNVPEEIKRIISWIGNNQNQREDDATSGEDYYSLSLDTLDMSSDEREHLEKQLSSVYGK